MNELTVMSSPAAIFETIDAADRINALTSATFDAEGKGWREQSKLIAEIETALAGSTALREAFLAARRPATAREIGQALYDLTEAFKSKEDQGERFGELLTIDVLDLKPGIGPLVAGCVKIRRTSKFRPKIAEVLEAIAAADSVLRRGLDRLDTMLPAQLAELKRVVEGGAG